MKSPTLMQISDGLDAVNIMVRDAIQRQRDLTAEVRASRMNMKIMLIAKLEQSETELLILDRLISELLDALADLEEQA